MSQLTLIDRIAQDREVILVANRGVGASTDRLPNAHLRVYPDANHGFLNQYPELFADHVQAFLNAG